MARAIAHKQEGWERADRLAVDDAIKALLATPKGRKFLWWMLQLGKVGLQPFNLDSHVTAFSCGELNVGNQLLSRLMEVGPDGYLAMMKEQANERAQRDTELSGIADSIDGDDYS